MYKIVVMIYTLLISFTNVGGQNENYLSMPLHETVSGYSILLTEKDYENYIYNEYNPRGLAFIKPDNSLWLPIDRSIQYKKFADDVISIKYDDFGGDNVILKTDGSVWKGKSRKITDNALMVDTGLWFDSIYTLKNDNTLWAYKDINNYSYENLPDDYAPIKVMDNVAYMKSTTYAKGREDNYSIIIKTDGSLWQFKNEDFNSIEKVTNDVVCADVSNIRAFAVKKDGSLYYWKCEDLKNKGIAKLTEDVKYAKFGAFGICLLKFDKSVWVYANNYNLPEGDDNYTLNVKLADNIEAILGDSAILLKDKNNKIMRIVDNFIFDENYVFDLNKFSLEVLDKYDIKTPEIKKKQEIKINDTELEEYKEITNKANELEKNLINGLNKLDKTNKENVDDIKKKIQEYRQYFKTNREKIIINASDAGKKGTKILTYGNSLDIFYEKKDVIEEVKTSKYNIEKNRFIKAMQ